MSTSWTATYHSPDGKSYPAIVFISSVTITVRYTGSDGVQRDLYWLEKEITAFDEKPSGSELQHQDRAGETRRLVITDPALVQAIRKSIAHNRYVGKPHQRVLGNVWTKIALVSGILLALILAAYFWFVPWLGERMAMNFSKRYEISMGEQMYKAMASAYEVDERKTQLINSFYEQLQYHTGYPVRVTVVRSAEVNAFAIPGGHIVVYDAILEKMPSPEALAALLGHEASHIALRHSLRNMFRSLARKMFLALLFGNESGIVSVMIDNADHLKGLQYSRALETEADNNGLLLMSRRQLDLHGMVRLMELLQKESGSEPSSLLSTHPVFTDRIANIKKQIALLPQQAATEHAGLKRTFRSLYENW